MKQRKRTPKERRKHLARAIYLTWSSLYSHLDYSIKTTKAMLKEGEDEHFHAEAIREYAEVILICSRELENLAPSRVTKKSRKGKNDRQRESIQENTPETDKRSNTSVVSQKQGTMQQSPPKKSLWTNTGKI